MSWVGRLCNIFFCLCNSFFRHSRLILKLKYTLIHKLKYGPMLQIFCWRASAAREQCCQRAMLHHTNPMVKCNIVCPMLMQFFLTMFWCALILKGFRYSRAFDTQGFRYSRAFDTQGLSILKGFRHSRAFDTQGLAFDTQGILILKGFRYSTPLDTSGLRVLQGWWTFSWINIGINIFSWELSLSLAQGNLSDEILQYFCFPEIGHAFGLRHGDTIIFNPQIDHCISSRPTATQDVICTSIYLQTAVVAGNDKKTHNTSNIFVDPNKLFLYSRSQSKYIAPAVFERMNPTEGGQYALEGHEHDYQHSGMLIPNSPEDLKENIRILEEKR